MAKCCAINRCAIGSAAHHTTSNGGERMRPIMPASGPWLAGVCASLCAAAAAAQDSSNSDDSAVLTEVTVTATRQSQSLSRVPLSVSAFSEQQLQDIGAKKVDDVVRQTPGISIGRATTSPLGATVTIRGIAAGG